MPSERGYERQIGPGGTASAPVFAGAAAFGGGVGDGLEQVGDALHRAEINAYQLERKQKADSEASALSAQYAAARVEADAVSRADQTTAGLDPAGHSGRMADWWAQKRSTMLDGITEDSVRERAQQSFDDFGASFQTRSETWQAGEAAKASISNVRAAGDTSDNRVRTAADAATLQEEGVATTQMIQAMQGVPQSIRDALELERNGSRAASFIRGLADKGELTKAMALLDKGVFNADLDPDQLEVLRNGVEVEMRRVDAQRDNAATVRRAQMVEAVATAKAQSAAGIELPDAVLAELATASRAAGDTSTAFELTDMRARNGINRTTAPWTPGQFERRIAALASKPARSPAEAIELDQLKKIAPERVQQFNADPWSWAALNQMPATPLDPAKPATFAARTNQARALAKATGRSVQPLTAAEAASLKDEAAGTAKQRSDLAGRLALFGPDGARAAAIQIAPKDGGLQVAATLPPGLRMLALDGVEVRRGNTQLVPAKDSETEFYDHVGAALRGLPGLAFAGTLETARNIYAAQAKNGGQTDYDRAAFRRVIDQIVGGGIGIRNGAAILLPTGIDQDEFDRRLTRIGKPLAEASNGPALWSDGSKVTGGELAKMLPVSVGVGLYRFETKSGGVVTTTGGAPWLLDIGKVR